MTTEAIKSLITLTAGFSSGLTKLSVFSKEVLTNSAAITQKMVRIRRTHSMFEKPRKKARRTAIIAKALWILKLGSSLKAVFKPSKAKMKLLTTDCFAPTNICYHTFVIRFTRQRFFKIFVVLALILLVGMAGATRRKVVVAEACQPKSFTGEIEPGPQTAFFEGLKIPVPEFVAKIENPKVLGEATGEKWIEVDLSEQRLKAWDGDKLFLETLVSTGLPGFNTPEGEFRIWSKARATRMEGGAGKYYYNLPNVPYVMFFENDQVPGFRGFSLHGTYWHNDFGKVHSHGCVNLPTPVAEKLYFWANPINLEGKGFIRSNEENPGTRVVIHE